MTEKKKAAPHPVLVPVDFSTHSEAALLNALALARCLEQPLVVLHVVHDPGTMPGYYSKALKKKQLHRIEDGALQMLEEFLQAVGKRHPEFQKLEGVESLLVKGLPSQRIIDVAEHRQAAMIVLGSKGLTGLNHLLIGSVAEQVVHLATVPVTVVKSSA